MTPAEHLEEMIAACDPGIREVVRFLNELGFETCDSGDGLWKFRCRACSRVPGERHDGEGASCGRLFGKLVTRGQRGEGCGLDYPHVYVQVAPAHHGFDAADRMARELRRAGVVVTQIGEMLAPDTPAGAWIQLTYDPVTESCFIELMQLNDAALRVARSSVRAEVPR